MPTSAIIILNWNGLEHLETCLSSVARLVDVRPRIVLVDNGSTDDSVAFVRKNFPAVETIETGKNLGFAEGNNVGVREVLKDPAIQYVAVLNNDTEVDAGWLLEMITVAESDEQIGAVASKMMNYYRRDEFDSAGDFLLPHTLKVVTRGAGERDVGQYDTTEECFSARAGAALYRRAMLEDIKLGNDYFDSHFFAYVEDTDLSVRARLRGWRIMYAPKAVVYHKVSATTKKMSILFQRFLTGRNRIYMAIKNLPVRLWLRALEGRSGLPTGARVGVIARSLLYVRIAWGVAISLPRLLAQRHTIQSRRTISVRDILEWRNTFSISS